MARADVTEKEFELMLAKMLHLEHEQDIPPVHCPKCGEDVTYWVSPCAEQGCPVGKVKH